MITLDHVTKSYKEGTYALNDVNIEIEDGEFVFIVGSSGSGKSTFIKLLLRELQPTSGKIIVAGRDLSRLKSGQAAKFRREIGCVFQDFRLLPDRNVYDNVAFAQHVIGVSKKEIRKNVPPLLTMVGLSEKYRSLPGELSGGEQQRVALARALVNKPKLLLADEPTGNLDPGNSWEIMKLLEEVNNQGTTVVVVTHNLEIVNAMEKRVITMKKGVKVSDTKQDNLIVRN
ncbi:MAG: cell division ATP-binding protein FtsE [Lachnospiraceae bacterium]|jgi:cell division transport system ATP-binding protein|nr:cell division ATP-binding protein FtsE [Lachnospiraceae bacterium]